MVALILPRGPPAQGDLHIQLPLPAGHTGEYKVATPSNR